MWDLRAGGHDTWSELFGDDSWIVYALINMKYQVEALRFANVENNVFRLHRYEDDPSTPKRVSRRVFVGEFDSKKELVAMAKLLLSNENIGE